MQPYFDPTRKTTSPKKWKTTFKKKWKTTSKKNGRRPQKKIKNERQPQKNARQPTIFEMEDKIRL
jgi:hypothetical protein